MKLCLFAVTTVLTAPSMQSNAFTALNHATLHQFSSLQPNQQHGVEIALAVKRKAIDTASSHVAASTATIKDEYVKQESSSLSSSLSSEASRSEYMADSIFDNIDSDKDGSVSNDELQKYLEEIVGFVYSPKSVRLLFATLDQNADGRISREEMRFAFSNYDIRSLHQAFGMTNNINSKKNNKSLSNKATADGNDEKVYTNAIDQIRSNANIDPRASPAMLNILADLMFDKIDTDSSGEIDLNELKEHYQNETANENNEFNDSAKSILTALDLNSDGVITRDEMRAGFNQFNPKSLSKALGVRASQTSTV